MNKQTRMGNIRQFLFLLFFFFSLFVPYRRRNLNPKYPCQMVRKFTRCLNFVKILAIRYLARLNFFRGTVNLGLMEYIVQDLLLSRSATRSSYFSKWREWTKSSHLELYLDNIVYIQEEKKKQVDNKYSIFTIK